MPHNKSQLENQLEEEEEEEISLPDFEPVLRQHSSSTSNKSLKKEKEIFDKIQTQIEILVENVDQNSEKEQPQIEKKTDISEKKKSLFEKESMYGNSTWFQKLTISWCMPIVQMTGEKETTIDDFGGMKEEESVTVKVNKLQDFYQTQPDDQKDIWSALFKTFKWEFYRFYICEIFMSAIRMTEPYMIQKLIEFLSDPKGDTARGLKILAALLGTQFFNHIIGHVMGLENRHLGHTAYSAMRCMVFNKQQKLSTSTSKNFSHGDVANYAQGCIGKVVHLCFEAITLARLPMYLIYSIYSLCSILGWTVCGAIFLIYFQMYFGQWIHSRTHKLHDKMHKINEKKFKYTSESIYSSKTLKFYNWTKVFEEEIMKWRAKELKQKWTIEKNEHINYIVGSFLPRLMKPLVFVMFFYFGGKLDLATSLNLIHMLDILNGRLNRIPHIQSMYQNCKIDIMLLQRYLNSPEVDYDGLVKQDKSESGPNPENQYAIQIMGESFSWGIKTKCEEEEREIKRVMRKDHRHSAFYITRMVNKLGKKVNAMIKMSDKYFAKPKAKKCNCEIECLRNRCECEIECQVMTQKEIDEKEKEMNEKDKEMSESTSVSDTKKETEIKKFKLKKCRVRCCSELCKCENKCQFKTKESEKKSTLDEIITLKDIDVKIKKGEFTCIIGECGSGKSSLLSTMIGDLLYVDPSVISKYGSGDQGMEKQFTDRDEFKQLNLDLIYGIKKRVNQPIVLNGNLSYAQQTPWIQNMTIRENILCGDELDEAKYYDTIKLCELERDFEILPNGDLTMIGERGINLSGGQKARIGLARAVYQDKDILLMDDPISALDAEVRKNIFRNVIFGHLKDKTCVLVTHAIDFLYLADKVIVMEKGQIITQGQYKDVKDHEIVQKLLKVNDLNKNKVTEKLNKEGEVVIKEESDMDYDSDSQEEEEQDESMEPTYTVNDLTHQQKLAKFAGLGKVSKKAQIVADDDEYEIKVESNVYWKLFKCYGGIQNILMISLISIVLIYIRIQIEYTIGNWSENIELQTKAYSQFLSIIATLTASSLFADVFKSVVLMYLNADASNKVHDSMIRRICNAPQNLFFDTHPNQLIMHKMRSDFTESFDQNMAQEFVELVSVIFNMISVICVIYMANPQILIVIPILFLISGVFFYYMIPAHKTICHLLDNSNKPIHMVRDESIHGNSTIRAFGKEEQFQKKNEELQNKNILAHYISMGIWHWFGLMNVINIIFISTIVCLIMIFSRHLQFNTIWQSMTIQKIWELHGNIWHLLHQSSNIERKMTKVYKCFKTLEIPQEKTEEDAITKLTESQMQSWPSKGDMEFKDVQMRYRPDCDLVLKGLSFKIKGGEKVGIVGRTGAGKSTIIQCISRLVEIENGSMEVDGVNISDIPINQLREQVTVIPQDPTLFTGSIRFNIDPTGKASDDEIIALLKRAGLEKLLNRERTDEEGGRGQKRKRHLEKKKIVDSDSDISSDSSSSDEDDDLEEVQGPLDMAVSEGGENLSSGEKQLLCICRAVLRKRRIIILDEATANIDIITEQKIQKFMKQEFKNQTMIVIAHRLQTIIESDKVMVLSDGRVQEMDSPQVLLENQDSHFTKLVNQLKKKKAEKEIDSKSESK